MIGKYLFLLVVLAFCEAAFIDTLGKCSIKDNECQRKLFTKGFQSAAKSGFPEYGIPPFDPYEIKNISVSVLDLVEISMVDGVAKNLKNCVFNSINTSIEDLHSSMEVTCDLTIKGHYKVSADGPVIKSLLGGGSVKGEGLGKVKIEKLHIAFDFDIFLRDSDGEIYIDCEYEDMHYKYDFGKVTFAADNLVIGKEDVSHLVVGILNENWKVIMTSFGKPFIDTAMEIVYTLGNRFFKAVPARMYLLENLEEYYEQ